LTDTLTDAPGKADGPGGPGGAGRARRLLHGWSANLVQMLLGLTQQLLLIPAFLHVWSGDTLAAWLAIYAAGSLVVVADSGLQLRAINRFLAFKSCADCDGRTASYYARMLRIYVTLVVVLGVLLLTVTQLVRPSVLLGFRGTASFDSAFIVTTLGMLLTLPSNLVSGLYRARGQYGRTVWVLNVALLLGQIAQLFALMWFGTVLAVAIAFTSLQLALAVFLLIDGPRLFPFLRRADARPRAMSSSLRWGIGQFGRAFPFAIANVTELALVNLPVLLVSALVTDRVAVAQWGLTRVIASLVRGLCLQLAMPLAAELGHDYAVGDRARLGRLYARGSVFVTVLASLIVAGLLPFWGDFFMLWTHGSIPYDAPLAVVLLLGSAAAAPSLLALAFATHSNRGDLLIRSKGLQLVVFLVLSIVLTSWLGPLGAALAIVASDILVQFGLLAFVVMGQTLEHPVRHTAFLVLVSALIVLSGWGAGLLAAWLAPGTGLIHFLAECAIWLVFAAAAASPLTVKGFRETLISAIPR
jgi:O-antigen/teichoic acid export membrane protein